MKWFGIVKILRNSFRSCVCTVSIKCVSNYCLNELLIPLEQNQNKLNICFFSLGCLFIANHLTSYLCCWENIFYQTFDSYAICCYADKRKSKTRLFCSLFTENHKRVNRTFCCTRTRIFLRERRRSVLSFLRLCDLYLNIS